MLEENFKKSYIFWDSNKLSVYITSNNCEIKYDNTPKVGNNESEYVISYSCGKKYAKCHILCSHG